MPKRASKAAFPKGGDKEAFLDAAYEMIAVAWVRLDEKNGLPEAHLTPRRGSASLAKEFAAAYAEAAGRRAAAKRARPLEAAALSRALALADHVDARRREPEPSLPPERLAEIAALLAEHEAAKKEYGTITTPWEDIRKKGEK
jgi:hypothetical protein